MSKYNVGLKTLLLQSLSIIARYEKIGYNIDVLRQTTCLVVNPVKVNSFAYLFDCTPVSGASD